MYSVYALACQGYTQPKGAKKLRLFAIAILFSSVLPACAPLAREHQADAAFRSALGAQLGGDADRAEREYRQVIALGFQWSPVWNNLAVLAVRQHQYIDGRRLLRRAVACNDRDVVALTNYGVMSYYLSDFREAERALTSARALRRDILDHIPSVGAGQWDADRWERATARLDATAEKYLARIDRAEMSGEPAPASEILAALTVHPL
jgi:Tfp pilus assembly protein PilF